MILLSFIEKMQRCRYMKQYMRIQPSNFSYRITSKRISCVAIYSVYHVGQILKAFIRFLSFASFNIVVCASHSTTSHLALVILRKGDPATRWDPERSRRHQKENANTRGIRRSGRQHFRRVYISPPKRRMLLRETDVNGVGMQRVGRYTSCMYVTARIMRETKARILAAYLGLNTIVCFPFHVDV